MAASGPAGTAAAVVGDAASAGAAAGVAAAGLAALGAGAASTGLSAVFSAGLASTGGAGWFSAALAGLVSPLGLTSLAGLASAAASSRFAVVSVAGLCADSEIAAGAAVSVCASEAMALVAFSAVAKVAPEDTNNRAMAVEARNRSTRESGIRDSPPSLNGANRLLGDDWPQFMADPATARRGAGTLRELRVFVPRRRLSLCRTIRILLPVAWRPRPRLSRSACSQIIPARVPWNNQQSLGL